MSHQTFERGIVNNIRLHVLPTDRFKTYAISVYVGQPLSEEWVTSTALIPFVLRRGTQKYPETTQFRERLDDLYGAGFGFDVFKRGDQQIIQFRMDIINDQYISESIPLLQESIDFLGGVLTNPVTDNGHFRDKYIDAEKLSLQKKLEAIINDKIKYAAERCIEEMCKNEPFRLHPLGQIDKIYDITSSSLYVQYEQFMNTAPIDLYVIGNTTLEEIKPMVEQAFKLRRDKVTVYIGKNNNPQVHQVNTVVEQLDVNQGKLNMGLRTYITYADENYPVALMYNGILGGYPHSKLFINVREKASLAYYASSRLDGHKGIMTIQSGIEMENYTKAVNIVKEQLEFMENGDISNLELSQTRAMISNQLREIQDSAFEMISFDFNGVLSGRERIVSELIDSIQKVDQNAVQQVARQIKLDTIYFLKDRKGE